jgi:hypothetical protein
MEISIGTRVIIVMAVYAVLISGALLAHLYFTDNKEAGNEREVSAD